MRKIKALFVPAMCLIAAMSADAAFVANRDFLSVGQGARANSMGEAFAGVADDPSAIYWNPAGLTQLKEDEVSGSFANRFDGLSSEAQVHYARRGQKAMWGFAYAGSYVTDISVTPSLTEDDINAIQTGAFAPNAHATKSVMDHAVFLAYSRPVSPDSPHSLGTTVKLIYRDFLGMVRGYGTGVDLGYHYVAPSGSWRFGTNVQNIASITSYVGTIDNLGVRATATESYVSTLRPGFAYTPTWRVLNGSMLFALDANMLMSFHVENYSAGLEYSFGEMIALRAGKVFGRQHDTGEDYSLGMGIRFKAISLDFSFLSNELGDTTRGTIGYRLGGQYHVPEKYKVR